MDIQQRILRHVDRQYCGSTLQELYYKNDQDIASDGELQNWWDEIKCAAATDRRCLHFECQQCYMLMLASATQLTKLQQLRQLHLAYCIAGAINSAARLRGSCGMNCIVEVCGDKLHC